MERFDRGRLRDGAMIVVAMGVALVVTGTAPNAVYTGTAVGAAALFFALAQRLDMSAARRRHGADGFSVTLAAWLLVCFGLLLSAYATKTTADVSRLTTGVWAVLAPLMIAVVRTVADSRGKQHRQGDVVTHGSDAVAIAGIRDAACTLAEHLKLEGENLYGYYDDRYSDDSRPSSPPLDEERRRSADQVHVDSYRGDFEQLIRDAREGRVQKVYIALPLKAEARIRHLVNELADSTADVHVIADVLLTELMQARLTEVGGLPVVSVYDSPFSGLGGWVKRLEDVVVGSLILALISIPMLVIALGIKLTSKGPVLFRQRRYGLNGEEITVLKFRSMTVCEDGAKVTQATKNDARITPFGAFLRRTSLDELPQFFHVLSGKMSIVGPRPHAVAHNEEYRRKIRGYMLRHKVKPGITGWAQVNGWRGETDTLEKMQNRIRHDLAYISQWGLWLDLKIIFLTVFGSAVRKNAY